jgi:hypothetical protein
MRANRTEYLFSVNTCTPPTLAVDSDEEFNVEVRGAFDDVEDISSGQQNAGGAGFEKCPSSRFFRESLILRSW